MLHKSKNIALLLKSPFKKKSFVHIVELGSKGIK